MYGDDQRRGSHCRGVVHDGIPCSEQFEADVRAKVERAIRELDYVPSAVARSLKAKSTATIGLLVPNATNPYFAELARGVEDGCAKNGYCVFFCNSDDDPAKQRNYLRVLQEKRIDGLVIASAGEDSVLVQSLAGAREPLVIVDRNIEDVSADLVQIDHEKDAYRATRHLLQLGHSQIGCITGPVATAVSRHAPARFYPRDGLTRYRNRAERHCSKRFSATGGYAAASQLFDGMKPTAIFACNDMMGIGALRAAAERRINVPTDCSIIGFDDVELSRYTYPALSTVGQSVRALSEMAAQTLIERITGKLTDTTRRRVVPPRLVRRESTAVVPETHVGHARARAL